MKRHVLLLTASLAILPLTAQTPQDEFRRYPMLTQDRSRYLIEIPNLNGYLTLKCDFHVHTVFSDAQVWPTTRVNEAWSAGLDAIAITDHIEHRVNGELLQGDMNTANKMAIKRGQQIGLIVIPGAEITRSKPLGHINALFIQDMEKLNLKDERAEIEEAIRQGAFLIWNHPGWPNDTTTLYPIQKELIAKGFLQGAEIFNRGTLYPKVIDWCHTYQLAPFANTDMHLASSNIYRHKCDRPMTLVFAKEYSLEGIHEALKAHRTLAFFNHNLAGEAAWMQQLIDKSLSVRLINEKKNTIEVTNLSDINFAVTYGKITNPIPLYAKQVVRIDIKPGTEVTFTNCFIGKEKYLHYILRK